jgi:hypothetical protein
MENAEMKRPPPSLTTDEFADHTTQSTKRDAKIVTLPVGIEMDSPPPETRGTASSRTRNERLLNKQFATMAQ